MKNIWKSLYMSSNIKYLTNDFLKSTTLSYLYVQDTDKMLWSHLEQHIIEHVVA